MALVLLMLIERAFRSVSLATVARKLPRDLIGSPPVSLLWLALLVALRVVAGVGSGLGCLPLFLAIGATTASAAFTFKFFLIVAAALAMCVFRAVLSLADLRVHKVLSLESGIRNDTLGWLDVRQWVGGRCLIPLVVGVVLIRDT